MDGTREGMEELLERLASFSISLLISSGMAWTSYS
jgi:hypothetical protein